MSKTYATVDDVTKLWRRLSADEQEQASYLIPIVEDSLRMETKKVGKDLDTMIEKKELYQNVLISVIVDIVSRTIEQNNAENSSTLSQESQSVNGYSWSGSYFNTGGGLGILKKDLKRLGIRRQSVSYVDMVDCHG